MSSPQHALALVPGVLGRRRVPRHPHLHGAELAWAVAFVVPYATVIAAFAVYPIAYALWLGGNPALYAELFSDPAYPVAMANTAFFAGFGANTMMFAALLLSGFFTRRQRWVKPLLAVCLLPWALPAIPAFVSFHWMLIGEYGFLNSALWQLFGIDGPQWFNQGWLSLGCDIMAYVWKWLPFWTLILVGGRMAIPQELYEAADIDGAGVVRRFLHITVPLLGNLYLICTALAAIWIAGDFTAVELVSNGAPARASDVLATLSEHYAFDSGRPALGVAAALSALPVLIPLVIVLMRRIEARAVQL
ncbi:MAG: sugar ABC transporter permease [Alphaproteobacteria bacterium]|nr:sugar ABC transporter permease [Alphaproteobacteria bacterium]